MVIRLFQARGEGKAARVSICLLLIKFLRVVLPDVSLCVCGGGVGGCLRLQLTESRLLAQE